MSGRVFCGLVIVMVGGVYDGSTCPFVSVSKYSGGGLWWKPFLFEVCFHFFGGNVLRDFCSCLRALVYLMPTACLL